MTATTTSATVQFVQVMGLLIAAGLGITAYFFRRGGVYNPKMPSLDREPEDLPFVPASVPSPSAPILPLVESITESSPKPTLEQFALAIRDFEGVKVNAKGRPDRNWKNNNPGNCRYSPVGYLPKYLPVLKDKDGFAIFKDYETGWSYLQNMLKAQIHLHPNWTILDMMTNYAPENDNNPTLSYAKHVAKRMGVDIRFKVKNIVV